MKKILFVILGILILLFSIAGQSALATISNGPPAMITKIQVVFDEAGDTIVITCKDFKKSVPDGSRLTVTLDNFIPLTVLSRTDDRMVVSCPLNEYNTSTCMKGDYLLSVSMNKGGSSSDNWRVSVSGNTQVESFTCPDK